MGNPITGGGLFLAAGLAVELEGGKLLQHVEKLQERGWSRSRARDYYDLWRIFNAYGGHLNEAIVSATAEIVVTMLPGKVDRVKSEETGLNVWKF